MSIHKLHIPFFTVIVFLLFACKKEDTQSPNISAEIFMAKQVYSIGDTIRVLGSYSDDNKITQVTVDLINDKSLKVGNASSYKSSEKKRFVTLSHEIIITDSTLKSGEYRVRLIASDGTQSTSKFLSIRLAGIPRRLTGWIFYDEENGIIRLRTIDSLRQIQDHFSTPGLLVGVNYHSVKSQLYITQNTSLSMQSYQYPSMAFRWNLSSLSPFYSLGQSDSTLYIGTYDGIIRGYDFTGINTFQADAMVGGLYPTKIMEVGKYLFTLQSGLGGGNYLVVYNKNTGGIIQSTILSFIPQDFCRCDDNSIFLLKKNSFTSEIFLYTISTNAVFMAKQINEPALSMCYLSDKHIALGGSSWVYDYKYASNSAVQAFYMPQAHRLYYEPITSTLSGITFEKIFFSTADYTSVQTILYNTSVKSGIFPTYNN